MLKYHFFFILFGISVFSCSEKEQQKAEPVLPPNQEAPLTILMREMYLDLEEMKVSVETGKAIKNYLKKHNGILTARPTDPKVKDMSFDLMAKGYMESLRVLENSPPELLLANYKILYSYCIACHESKCPGPIKKITNLQIE
jgi:hypothetical protein